MEFTYNIVFASFLAKTIFSIRGIRQSQYLGKKLKMINICGEKLQ